MKKPQKSGILVWKKAETFLFPWLLVRIWSNLDTTACAILSILDLILQDWAI